MKEVYGVKSKESNMDNVTKPPEVGQIVAPKRSRFNISGAIGLVNLKIDQKIARDTLSIITKVRSCNCWGWGENRNFGLWCTCSIFSGANGFAKLKIDQWIDRGALAWISSFMAITTGVGEKSRFYLSLFST